MPVNLNNLNNQWFNQKQVDTNGDGVISRQEMGTYTNNAAQKPASEQSWEEALGGKLIHSADNNGGESFFDIVSKYRRSGRLKSTGYGNAGPKRR